MKICDESYCKMWMSEDNLDYYFYVGCCWAAKSCPALCNPMDCSMPGFPVLHYLSELAQTHVHWASDAIQPSHLLLSPSPAFNLSQEEQKSLLHKTWNHWIAQANRCWCQLHASFLHIPHLILWDVLWVLFSPPLLSQGIATTSELPSPGLSYHHLWATITSHLGSYSNLITGLPASARGLSFETQVRSWHFSAQTPSGPQPPSHLR